MQHIASPLIRFLPVQPETLPERWEQTEYLVALRLFGILPIGRQWVNISGRDRSGEKGRFYVELRDNGRGTLVSKWDHTITIEATDDGGCRYCDRVEVEAGAITPLVWLFARFFYRHRQQRWRRLIARGFSYEERR